MDPLSVSASIIAVLQLTGTVLSYLNDVRNATKDQEQLAVEASNIYSLLTALRFRVDQSNGHDPWFTAVRNLGTENGPLDQVREALERLASKSMPSHGIKNLGKQLLWKVEKSELEGVLRKIERVKSLVNIALTSDIFSLSQAMKEELSTIDEGVHEINQGVINLHDGQQRIREDISDISVGVNARNVEQQEEERRQIEDWLSLVDFRSRQQDILKGAQAGTRQWLFDSKKFQNWVNADRGTLWCPGIPGAGKTVTSSIIISHLQSTFKDDNIAVTCLFCNYRDRAAQSAESFMANLLKQVLQQKGTISPGLKHVYEERKKNQPNFAELARLFSHEISHFSKTFVLIDALDETSEHEDIRMLVLSELQNQPINLLVTSRYETSIERRFETAERLEIRATAADVQTYVEARIPSEHLLARHIQADSALEKTIVDSIVEKSQGMFLMARFHMDSLVTKTKRKDVRKALESLPPELDGIYDRAIERIEGQGKDYSDLAKRVLMWVSNAFCPLSPVELQSAIAVQPGMTELDDEDLDDQDLTASVCAGLVVLDAETDTLRFVHYTTQEYFDRKGESLFGNANAHIATSCITYLNFTTFAGADSWISVDDDLQRKGEFYLPPLTQYAAFNWAKHAREVAEANVTDAVLSFLNQTNNVIRAARLVPKLRGHSNLLAERFSALGIASIYGLSHVMERLLYEGAPADSRDSCGRTPLMLAAIFGHLSAVKLLVERDDVDVNARTNPPYSLTSLILAAQRVSSRSRVIQVLLQGGADANIRSHHGTALNCAVNSRDKISIGLLLEAGADPNVIDDIGQSPLHDILKFCAFTFDSRRSNAQQTIVRSLCEKGSRLDTVDHFGNTPLHIAAAGGSTFDTFEFLLDKGAKIDSVNNNGCTPLLMTVRSCFPICLAKEKARLLLTRGANLQDRDIKGATVVHWATSSLEMLQFLVEESGAEVNAKTKDGSTPLHWALSSITGSARLEIAWYVIDHGVDPEARNIHGRTAFENPASETGEAELREILMKPYREETPQSPLQLPSRKGMRGGKSRNASCYPRSYWSEP